MRSGQARYLAGQSAEDRVVRDIMDNAGHILARRVRAGPGEIDIISRQGGTIVFTEVKARRTLDAAAAALSPAQAQRIIGTALAWLASQGLSQDTDMRFDVALADRAGRIAILPNVLAA